jgi:hypothetical protein
VDGIHICQKEEKRRRGKGRDRKGREGEEKRQDWA